MKLSAKEIEEIIKVEQLVRVKIDHLQRLQFRKTYNDALVLLEPLSTHESRMNYIVNSLEGVDDVSKSLLLEVMLYKREKFEEDLYNVAQHGLYSLCGPLI